LPYNIELSNDWGKDFQQTNYLGGSIQGDWNPAVNRSGTYSTDFVIDEDSDLVRDMRKLATYAGICHIRTPEGSSFACDVQVTETHSHASVGMKAYSLKINQVDSQDLDGLTYDEWIQEE